MAPAATGRTPRPRHLKLLEGRAPGKDSAGRDVPEPPKFSRGAPTKPSNLSPDADWLWDEIVTHWNDLDLLKPLDAASLEVACETFARWREAVRWRREHGHLVPGREGAKVAPYIGVEERASKDFRAWCAEYGLSPAAEGKITGGNGGGGEDTNPFV